MLKLAWALRLPRITERQERSPGKIIHLSEFGVFRGPSGPLFFRQAGGTVICFWKKELFAHWQTACRPIADAIFYACLLRLGEFPLLAETRSFSHPQPHAAPAAGPAPSMNAAPAFPCPSTAPADRPGWRGRR